MPNAAQYAAMATLLCSIQDDVGVLLGLLSVSVGGQICQLPLLHSWQDIPGVPGVQMCSLDPGDWPANARPGEDYHMLRGPGGSHSPGLLRVPQALRLEILKGSQAYWKESAPEYVRYGPGDVFTCAADEGHQWETFEEFLNRVSFSPALFPRPTIPDSPSQSAPAPRPDFEPSGCSVTPDLP